MKIGLVFSDKGFSNLDLRHPENGNPGVGGTEFCFLMLARYLTLTYDDIDVFVYHWNVNKFPKGIISKIIVSENELIYQAKNDKIDILIFRNGYSEEWYKLIHESCIKSIVWAHNYISASEVDIINNNDTIKRVLFVGKQQYDRYIDDDIIKKSQYIYNMFNADVTEYKRKKFIKPNVTYTGSLVEVKGFHILAKQWKEIIKEVPDAKLNVIGSGKLYDRNAKLGKYNIAEDKYEKKFIEYLTDDNGEILPSVKFWGVVGQEKIDIYQNTMVGIINPTGITETFGLSAVEMEACGIPVVTKRIYGLPDTIKHKKTGLLSSTEKKFRINIIKLLKDIEYNSELGNNAKRFVREEFDPNKLIIEWMEMFNDILKNKKPNYYKPTNYFFNDYKYLRMINRVIRKKNRKMPSIIKIKNKLSKIKL